VNPILLEFPGEFETERLFIRKPLPGDGIAVYEAVQASLIELKKWMPWALKTQTLEDMEANMRDAYAKFLTREDLRLHLYKKIQVNLSALPAYIELNGRFQGLKSVIGLIHAIKAKGI
jgi:hypothetical protein